MPYYYLSAKSGYTLLLHQTETDTEKEAIREARKKFAEMGHRVGHIACKEEGAFGCRSLDYAY